MTLTPYRYNHAKHDPGTCLAAGLFQPLMRGKRPSAVIHIAEYKNLKLEFRCFWQLGADDLRVLQGLLALASPTSTPEILTDSAHETPRRNQLRKALRIQNYKNAESLFVSGSYYLLARETGLRPDGANTFRRIRESIDRLSLVNVRVTQGESQYASNLLAYGADEKCIDVLLNPRLTAAVLGGRISTNGGHTRIDLTEVRSIESDATRILHQYLSALIAPGESRHLLGETMIQHIWPGKTTTPNAAQKQRKRLVESLEELRKIGWRYQHTAGSRSICGKSNYRKYQITRPAPVEIGFDDPLEKPTAETQAPTLETLIRKKPGIALRDYADQLNLTEFGDCVTRQPVTALTHCLDRLSKHQIDYCLAKNPKSTMRKAAHRLDAKQISLIARQYPADTLNHAIQHLDRSQQKQLVIRHAEKLLPWHQLLPPGLLDEVAPDIPFEALRFAKNELSKSKLLECMEKSPVGAIRYAFENMTAAMRRDYLQLAPWAMLALRSGHLTNDEIDRHYSCFETMTLADFHHRKRECPEIHIYVKFQLQSLDHRYCAKRAVELAPKKDKEP